MIKTYKKVKIEPISKNAYNLKHYHDNKDIILERYLQPVVCTRCGSIVTKVHMARHRRTDKFNALANLI